MVLFILILMFITPIISVMSVLLKFTEMKQAVSWPQVTGQVTNVRLLESGKQYQPELDITYTVGETTYNSRLKPVSQTGQAQGSKAWAREFSLQFKPGTAVPLYYDPNRPKRATLSPRQMQPYVARWQITSGFMILLSVGIHLLGARGIIANYLNLSGNSVAITMLITTVVTLLLGAALALLLQETRHAKT